MKTFTEATNSFLTECDYLGDSHIAEVTALQQAAKNLDEEYKVTLATEYRRLVQLLRSYAPEAEEIEEEDDLLSP